MAGAPFWGGAMKVRTFTGTSRATVDKQVNDWLANVAFKAMREWGPDAIAGKTSARRALAIAITVWYDEKPIPQSRPDTWKFSSRQR
jgi:hypothetical protein